MTQSATNFDLPSLHLLLPEIEVALKDAETHLSEFHDDEDQAPLLMDSAVVIEQLAAIFDLISFKGTSDLTYAIAGNLKKLHDSGDNSDTSLVMDISEGIMVLDRYIEFVLLKEVLEPSLLLPIINKLRGHLGQAALSLENLNHHRSISISNPATHYQSLSTLGLNTQSLSNAFRLGLAVALDDNNAKSTNPAVNTALASMDKACRIISQKSNTLFWQAAYAATQNLKSALPLSNAKKRILIYIEQQFFDYLPIEDKRFADLVSFACQRDEQFAEKVRSQFSLYTSEASQLDKMRRFLFGPNREITDTLNNIIQSEIISIKEKVDSLARGSVEINAASNTDIAEQIASLGLAMRLLSLEEASDALSQAATEMRAWQTPTPADFDKLLAELMVAENAAIFLTKTHTPGAIKLPLQNRHISLHQLDTAYDLLIKESRINISTISQMVIDYLADANRDATHLQHTPEMLSQVAGAAGFLRLPSTAKMLARLARYIDETVSQEKGQLTEAQLAQVADVVVAADYYLEAFEDNRPVDKQAILRGQHSLNRLLAA
ncbi:MAG: hypothetical protein Q4G13_09815 [Moraxella sp.]|nr:hypothetical protein [Moraxella sp.]